MKVAVLGTGKVGSALGSALARAGHGIVFASRDPQSEGALAAVGKVDGARSVSFQEAVDEGDVVLLVVPFEAAEEVIGSLGRLAGTILIDCTNAVAADDRGPKLGLSSGTSAGEMIAAWADDAQVFKAFNQVGYEVLGDAAAFADQPPFMLVAGPDGSGKETVLSLVQDAGFDPQDIGGIEQSRLLEALAMIWIHLAGTGRTDRRWALGRMTMPGEGERP